MSWEPTYAILIIFTSLSTWACAIFTNLTEKYKKIIITICLLINLLILFLFKYYNFATDIIASIISPSGIRINIPYSHYLLPVGISFYTFQCIGYIIDVYRKDIEAEKNFVNYAVFVSFFPQLVAGPIERAKNLLPQFHTKHRFNGDTFIEGLKMMIWGYFMKLCIAGNVAPYVDAVYNNVPNHNGTSFLLASFFFSFQIFCDFGGYSLIAIGTAKCLGFTLMQNFNHPYLSQSVKEFWRRWHISLSSWFADYVYKPLGGSRCSTIKHNRNLLLTMLISGLWHGANWTFVLWGGLHGMFLIVNSAYSKFVKHKSLSPKIIRIITTYFFIVFAWIFFRANNVQDAFTIISKITTEQGHLFLGDGIPSLVLPILMICILLIKEIKDEYQFRISLMHHKNPWISIPASALVIAIILLCAEFNSGQFIYFQF
jgi:D-alanyl-lipoteichoic acid acyltransferase DltB (MBOAT superfamily)